MRWTTPVCAVGSPQRTVLERCLFCHSHATLHAVRGAGRTAVPPRSPVGHSAPRGQKPKAVVMSAPPEVGLSPADRQPVAPGHPGKPPQKRFCLSVSPALLPPTRALVDRRRRRCSRCARSSSLATSLWPLRSDARMATRARVMIGTRTGCVRRSAAGTAWSRPFALQQIERCCAPAH